MARYLRRWPKSVETAGQPQEGIISSALLIHEFKAPLADLQAFIQSSGIGEQQSLILSALTERLDGLQRLIDQILTATPGFARQSAQWTDPDDVLCALINQLTAVATAKQLRLGYSCAVGTGREFFTQTLVFELLIRNLTTNAIKHTNQGNIEISLDERPDCLRVSISDDGKGLPQKTADFLQGKLSYEQYYTDTHQGIGVLLARYAADRLDAEIRTELQFSEEVIEPGATSGISFAESGTIIEITIPGQWRSNQVQKMNGVVGKVASEVVADLSALAPSEPELCRQLKESGLRHEPNTKLKIDLRTDVYPHIVCTLGDTDIEHAPYPCSGKRLREMIQGIATSKATAPATLLIERTTQPRSETHKSTSISHAKPSEPSRLALVIDDSELSRRRCGQLLNSRGWLMVEASSHSIGARAQRRCQFDLIIEDACLPGVAMTNEASKVAKVAISAERELAEGLARGPGLWIDALVKPVNEQDFERILGSWRNTQAEPGWDLQLAKLRLGGDYTLAIDGGAEMLSDYLLHWPSLVRASKHDDRQAVKRILHRLCGGLLYSGFPALQQRTATLHDQIGKDVPISKTDIDSLSRILRQTIILFKAQPGQNQKLGCKLQPVKF